MFHDLPGLIASVGLVGIWAIIFIETGLLVGFFLPGDSLLFTAGFLASQGYLPLGPLIIGCFIAAVVGDSVGYQIGRRAGERLFRQQSSRWFRPEYVERAKEFYVKYGIKTIVLARFVPVVRTFAPVLAGIGQMEYRTFLIYNVFGGALWAVGLPVAGYYLGKNIPNIDHYLFPVIGVIVLVSLLPAIKELWPIMVNWRKERK